jgi:hypothetical protein
MRRNALRALNPRVTLLGPERLALAKCLARAQARVRHECSHAGLSRVHMRYGNLRGNPDPQGYAAPYPGVKPNPLSQDNQNWRHP